MCTTSSVSGGGCSRALLGAGREWYCSAAARRCGLLLAWGGGAGKARACSAGHSPSCERAALPLTGRWRGYLCGGAKAPEAANFLATLQNAHPALSPCPPALLPHTARSVRPPTSMRLPASRHERPAHPPAPSPAAVDKRLDEWVGQERVTHLSKVASADALHRVASVGGSGELAVGVGDQKMTRRLKRQYTEILHVPAALEELPPIDQVCLLGGGGWRAVWCTGSCICRRCWRSCRPSPRWHRVGRGWRGLQGSGGEAVRWPVRARWVGASVA